MTVSDTPDSTPPVHTQPRWLPVLMVLFVGSGCAALIYEVVWFQLLQLSIGSSAVSLGVLLGIYMGGMCLGSWLFADYVSASEHPLKVYSKIEAGIGLYAILLLFVFYFVLGWAPPPGQLDAGLDPGAPITGMYVVDSLLRGNWPVFRNAFAHLVLPAGTAPAIAASTMTNVLASPRLRYSTRVTRIPALPTINRPGSKISRQFNPRVAFLTTAA